MILNLMPSIPFKRPKLNLVFDKQTPTSNRNPIALLPYNDLISFFSSPPITWSLLIQNISVTFLIEHYQANNQMFCPSLPISPQDFLSTY